MSRALHFVKKMYKYFVVYDLLYMDHVKWRGITYTLICWISNAAETSLECVLFLTENQAWNLIQIRRQFE